MFRIKLARLRIRFRYRVFPLFAGHGYPWKDSERLGMKFSGHLNFTVQPKYYISQHFNFTVWPKYYNLWHFNFVVVLKIEFSMCEFSFPQLFMNFGKSMEPKCKLKYIFIFFYIPVIHESIKSTRKTSLLLNNNIIFIIWVYTCTYKPQDLIIFFRRVKKLCIIKL